MIPLGGGASGRRRTRLPPPPPALPSYSSNLSPLAPPFTVGPPPPALRDPRPWSLFNAPGAPYYHPHYDVGAREVFDPLPEPEGYGVGLWDGIFDGEDAGRAGGGGGGGGGSSWFEPPLSSKNPSSSQEGVWHGKHAGSFAGKVHLGSECLEWFHDKHPTIYEEDATVPYSISRESVLVPSPLPKGNSYSQLPDSSSNFSSNACDAFMGYQANVCSTSVPVHAPSSWRTSSFAEFSMLKNYSMAQPVDPYKIGADCEDQISSNPKEFNDNQDVEVREGYGEMMWGNNMKILTNVPVDTFPLETSLPSGSELANGSSIGTFTEEEPFLKLKPLNLPSAYNSEAGPTKPNYSVGTSSQTVDQINLSVDSPCWKGASVSQRLPFSVAEIVGLHPAVKEWNDFDDLDQDEKHLPLDDAYSETSPSLQQAGTFICNENKSTYPEFSSRESPVVILPSIQKNLDDASKVGAYCLKDNSEETNHCSVACKEQSNEVREDLNGKSEATPLGKEETVVSAIQPVTGGTVANLETYLKPEFQENSSVVNSRGKPSFSGNDIELLVKTINCLSEVLFSSCNGGTIELKEHHHELLKMSVRNLEVFTLSRKKAIATGSFHVSAPKAVVSQDVGLNADIVLKQANNTTTHNMKWKEYSSGSSNVSTGDIEELGKTNNVAQAFEKVLERSLPEPEENPQALVYKNLWIEAEAALCSMKYELQLAHMKMENHNHHIKERSPRTTGLSSWNNVNDLDGCATLHKANERLSGNITLHRADAENKSCVNIQETPRVNANKSEDLDASTLARLRVLKSRIDVSDHTVLEHQPHLGMIDLGFLESKAQTIVDTPNKGKGDIGTQFGCVKYRRAFSSSESGYTAGRESHGSSAEGSVIEPYVPSSQERRSVSAGWHDSPTSEWEHVLKEDLVL